MASEERKEKKVTSKGEREKAERKKNVKMDNIRETLKLGQKERI